MVHVHSIKCSLHIVLWAPPTILSISGNLFLWFLDSPLFKNFKSLSITLVRFHYFRVFTGMDSVTSSYLNCFKDRSVFSNLDRQVVIARIVSSLGSDLVHFPPASMLFYFSVAFWMSNPAGTSVLVYQSYLFLPMKLLKVEFGTDNRTVKMSLT